MPMPATKGVSLSVLVPVYNEKYLVSTSLARLTLLQASEQLSRIEVIVVDDGSTDGTDAVLRNFEACHCPSPPEESKMSWIFLHHERNAGKGAAVQTALARASGEISVIHDADLEYDPRDLLHIVRVLVEQDADAVFGSR